jgi:hypothetical protein
VNVISALDSKMAELSSGRKGRKISPELTTKVQMGSFEIKNSFTPHASKPAGITSLAVKSSQDSNVILTGGVDKSVILSGIYIYI